MGALRVVVAPGRCLSDRARICFMGEHARWRLAVMERRRGMGKGGEVTEKTEMTDGTEKSQERYPLFRHFRLVRNRSADSPYNPAVGRRRWALRAMVSLGLLLAVCVALFFALPELLIAPANVTKSDVILHGAISPHSTADEYVADLYR